ncbi:DUF4129 domain-containing protein [Aquibacillus halophilus]|uniref:DUF4129 domain-containing protein n=1 Tax=Aquibacillus halophilus TaxID=930132 RepID=UPI00196A1E95|nr:DUF4129 domain-containing protein [Aquibacillus halophilus]
MYNEKRARDQLEDILSRQEFQVYYEDNRNFIERWWDQARSWVADLLANWFSSIEPSSGLPDGILISVVIVILTTLIVIIFVAARSYRRKRTFRDHTAIKSIKEMDWSFENHLTEAKKQGELQQYTIATRHLFLALLLYLHEKEWLEARIWKTNWEYYDELRQFNQNSAEQFYNLALLFDEVTYGERDINQPQFMEYRDEVIEWLAREDNGQSLEQWVERWNE